MGLPELQPLPIDSRENTQALAPVAARPRVSALALASLVVLGLVLGTWLALQRPAATPDGSAPLTQRLLQAVGAVEPDEKLVFSVTPTQPQTSADLLPAGSPAIYAFYELPGVKSRAVPTVRLSKDGRSVGVVPASQIALGTKVGTGTVTLRNSSGGFPPGLYELELAFPQAKVTGSFVIAAAAEAIAAQPAPKDAEVAIADTGFASSVAADGKANKPQKAFWGSQRVYFTFHYAQAEPGSTVQIKWFGGQQQIDSATSEVLLPSVEGWANAWLQAPYPGLPAGDYHATVNMSSDTKVLASADFSVMAGTPPTAAPATR